jgi:hypothetical protein
LQHGRKKLSFEGFFLIYSYSDTAFLFGYNTDISGQPSLPPGILHGKHFAIDGIRESPLKNSPI